MTASLKFVVAFYAAFVLQTGAEGADHISLVQARGKSAFAKVLQRRGIRHIVSRPRHPQTLGQRRQAPVSVAERGGKGMPGLLFPQQQIGRLAQCLQDFAAFGGRHGTAIDLIHALPQSPQRALHIRHGQGIDPTPQLSAPQRLGPNR